MSDYDRVGTRHWFMVIEACDLLRQPCNFLIGSVLPIALDHLGKECGTLSCGLFSGLGKQVKDQICTDCKP